MHLLSMPLAAYHQRAAHPGLPRRVRPLAMLALQDALNRKRRMISLIALAYLGFEAIRWWSED